MRSPRLLLTTLGTVAAAATMVAATTMPAHAAGGPYVVKTGTKTTGTSAFSGATTGALPQIKFSANGVDLGCDSGTATGAIKNGNRPTGTKMATITSSTWTNCTGPLGLALTVTQEQTWYIDGTGPVQPNAALPGRITTVKAFVSAANPSQCSFRVTGGVNGKLLQRPAASQSLKVNGGGLKISDVVGCFGLISNGNGATFSANYALTSPDGILSIKNG